MRLPFAAEPGPRRIVAVAERLGPLAGDVVFLGGACVPLLISDAGAASLRETRDVDLVVEVASRAAFAKIEATLRRLGFQHDTAPGAPLCRWVVGGLVVDVMPADPAILGFSNPWYPFALASAWTYVDAHQATVRVVSAPAFVLTKWAAFQGRGGGTDYAGSHDLEDILAVVDGRQELPDEVAGAPPEPRAALQAVFRELLGTERFRNLLPGLVERGREPVVVERMSRMAALPSR